MNLQPFAYEANAVGYTFSVYLPVELPGRDFQPLRPHIKFVVVGKLVSSSNIIYIYIFQITPIAVVKGYIVNFKGELKDKRLMQADSDLFATNWILVSKKYTAKQVWSDPIEKKFANVHGVKLTNDGLVFYISNMGKNKVKKVVQRLTEVNE